MHTSPLNTAPRSIQRKGQQGLSPLLETTNALARDCARSWYRSCALSLTTISELLASVKAESQEDEGHETRAVRGSDDNVSPTVQAEEIAARGPSSTMEYNPGRSTLQRALGALHHRDFRLFWSGQLVSLVGTWMQTVAQSWLVLQLSGSPFTLGIITALQFLPVLVLSVVGGVLADRLPKRQVLLATQSSAMVLAFILAILAETKLVQIWHVMVLAFLLGLVNALDMPTRQAFLAELVGRANLRNAIALNSAAFNSARLVGPAVAGLAIGWVGVAGCFFLNGLSFVAVIVSLTRIAAGRGLVAAPEETRSLGKDLKEGLSYVIHTPVVRVVVLMMAIVGTFGMNMNVLVPVFAQQVLSVGAEGYGLLTSSMGTGSLVAALIVATLGRASKRRFVIVAAAGIGILEMALVLVRQFPPAMVTLAGVGFAMIFFTTLSNMVLQTSVPDHLRGRVMSVYTTVFAGTTPFGSLFAGSIAESWGAGAAFFAGGVISLIGAGVGLALSRGDGTSATEKKLESRDGQARDRSDGRAA